jgi:hypothetical protein
LFAFDERAELYFGGFEIFGLFKFKESELLIDGVDDAFAL